MINLSEIYELVRGLFPFQFSGREQNVLSLTSWFLLGFYYVFHKDDLDIILKSLNWKQKSSNPSGFKDFSLVPVHFKFYFGFNVQGKKEIKNKSPCENFFHASVHLLWLFFFFR